VRQAGRPWQTADIQKAGDRRVQEDIQEGRKAAEARGTADSVARQQAARGGIAAPARPPVRPRGRRCWGRQWQVGVWFCVK